MRFPYLLLDRHKKTASYILGALFVALILIYSAWPSSAALLGNRQFKMSTADAGGTSEDLLSFSLPWLAKQWLALLSGLSSAMR